MNVKRERDNEIEATNEMKLKKKNTNKKELFYFIQDEWREPTKTELFFVTNEMRKSERSSRNKNERSKIKHKINI